MVSYLFKIELQLPGTGVYAVIVSPVSHVTSSGTISASVYMNKKQVSLCTHTTHLVDLWHCEYSGLFCVHVRV